MPHVLKAAPVVLPLADVKIAGQPLAETASRYAVEDRLRALAGRDGSRSRGQLEACSSYGPQLIRPVDCHPLVAALRLAHAEHRPLRLSPDMIWLSICQGVAQHVHANAEELRGKFVQHHGRATLEITVDSERFHKGSPENPWPEALTLFSQRIRDHVGEKHGWFVADFSTTGPAEKAASEVALMDVVEAYFSFRLSRVICGIPHIELEGTSEDWRSLSDRAAGFRELGLRWWIDPLQAVVRKFCDAAAGSVDQAFWRSIYRVYQPDEYCSPKTALGWFTVLFPYLSDGRRGSPPERNPWLTGTRDLHEMLEPEATVHGLCGRTHHFVFESMLPTGLSRVPFQWRDRTPLDRSVREFSMEFLAGFFGVRQDRRTMCLRPEIGWAVRDVSDRKLG
jgi:hypothetical protein